MDDIKMIMDQLIKLNESDNDINNHMIIILDLLEKYIKETIKLELSIKSIENRLDYIEEYIKHKFKEKTDNYDDTIIPENLCNRNISINNVDDIYKRILWIEQRLQILEDKQI